MGFCPNCGSYVSPGSNVCSCGTTLGGSHSTNIEVPYDKPKPTLKQSLISTYSNLAKKYFDCGDYERAIEFEQI